MGLRECEISRARLSHVLRRGDGSPLALKIHGKGRKGTDQALLIPPQIAPLFPPTNGRATTPLCSSHRTQSLGRPLSTRGIRWIIDGYLHTLHLPTTPHGLRHTAAVIAITAGASVEDVQQLLRHRDRATTLIYLSHFPTPPSKAPEILIANTLWPIPGDHL